jgi:2'-5' RNA ligase
MRLFLAVDLPDAVKAWAGRVRTCVERRQPAAARGLRWVAPAQMHLTLRFLGETAPGIATALSTEVSKAFPIPAFTLRVGQLAWLPPRGRPRVLVADIAEGRAELAALKTTVDDVVRRLTGLGPEERPFTAHVTLARVREDLATLVDRDREAVIAACGLVPDLVSPIDRVVLYRSELSPRGPTYTALATAALAGPAGP